MRVEKLKMQAVSIFLTAYKSGVRVSFYQGGQNSMFYCLFLSNIKQFGNHSTVKAAQEGKEEKNLLTNEFYRK